MTRLGATFRHGTFLSFLFTFLMKQCAAKTIDKTNSKSFLNCSYIDPKSYGTPSTGTYAKNVWRRAKLEHLKLVSLKGFMDQNEEMSLIRLIKELVSVNSLFMSVIDQNRFGEFGRNSFLISSNQRVLSASKQRNMGQMEETLSLSWMMQNKHGLNILT